ncbi:bifunctional 4-hydroxy-3-methylbut-2-enyl diphosphate reductase/30S ribosomal protein S1 [Tissierellaceae bacterium HCP3S3_D8]
MKIIVADNAGFCFGVNRAMEIANTEIHKKLDNLFSYGPLIHNPQAVDMLKNQGLIPIDDISKLKEGNVIIRSHGIPKQIEEEFKRYNVKLIDTTCPYVKAVHKRVENFRNKGYNIVIIGDPEHPEVIGINGWCNNEAYIVNTPEDVQKLSHMDSICVVSQTTNTEEKFNQLSKLIESKGNTVEIFNTICNATKNRQNSAKDVASIVDAMIVIGGYKSSNTLKLVEISKKYCKNVFHIETIKDMSLQELSKFNTIGITAGASTPDWIIKEAVEVMDNLNNNEMMEAIENSFTKIHRGDIVEGEVIFVTNDEVMVNINYKSDGIITKDELSNDPDINPKEVIKAGDKIQVYVIKVDDGEGNVVLSSKRVEEMTMWEELEENFNNKDVVKAKVIRVVKGGLIALAKGINAFIPASHVSINYVTDLSQFVGKEFMVTILDFDKQKRRVILSRKEVERVEVESMRDKLWNSLEEGAIIEGIVQRLTNFGAFVDLGGVDGLIHISDLSWNRVKHPSEVVKPGDKVEVQVLSFNKEKNRISLGLKQTVEEPWELFKRNVQIGDIVEGKVVNLLDFGAFIRLKEGVDGLLHVSQISKEHIEKPSDVLNIGDNIKVKVIDIDEEDRRISLSKRELETEEKTSEDVEEKNVPEEDVTIKDIIDNK